MASFVYMSRVPVLAVRTCVQLYNCCFSGSCLPFGRFSWTGNTGLSRIRHPSLFTQLHRCLDVLSRHAHAQKNN